MLFGGIEGGGTKFVCAVATDSGEILARERFPTKDPHDTVARAVDVLKGFEAQQGETLAAIGIASFGPLDLTPTSKYYGYVTATPKPKWDYADVVGPVKAAFSTIPVGFDTDVNGAALGEQRWGAAQEWDTFVYFTIGTGIGGGGMVGGRLIHGLVHPEMGHILLPMHKNDPLERGVCPFHSNCLEGLAAGPSLHARWGTPGQDLPEDHAAWELEAHYLAHAIEAIMMILSPQGVILGGSVMHQPRVLPLVRQKVKALVNGYVQHPRLEGDLSDFIVRPGLGDDAGVMGAIALAMQAHARG